MIRKNHENGASVWNNPRMCTGDHLKLKANGGLTTRQNIVAACLECNGRRHRDYLPPPHISKAYYDRRAAVGPIGAKYPNLPELMGLQKEANDEREEGSGGA